MKVMYFKSSLFLLFNQIVILCSSHVFAVPAPPCQFVPVLQQLINIDGIEVDGSYSKGTTLTTRLPFFRASNNAMTIRHFWHYMSILTLALDTFPESVTLTESRKNVLLRALHRLQHAALPEMIYEKIEDSFYFQVDNSMLRMVHQNLKDILVFHGPEDDMFFQTILSKRHLGTTALYRELFNAWGIASNHFVIQLLARIYLPFMYVLHMVHDGDYVYHQCLFDRLYSPLHESLANLPLFLNTNSQNERFYEVVLIVADSLHSTN